MGFSSYTRKPSNSSRRIRIPAALVFISPLERCTSVSNITLGNTFRVPGWKSPGHPISLCLSELAAPFPQTSWGKHPAPWKSSELPSISGTLSLAVSDAQMNWCWKERWEFFNCIQWTVMILNPFYMFSNILLTSLWGTFKKRKKSSSWILLGFTLILGLS